MLAAETGNLSNLWDPCGGRRELILPSCFLCGGVREHTQINQRKEKKRYYDLKI